MPFKTLKRLILPHDALFFDLMLRQAQTASRACAVLVEMTGDFKNAPGYAVRIRDYEHEGDGLLRDVYKGLNTTFIVPIDHGDISMLACALDDVIDGIDHVSTALVAYKITSPSPSVVRLSEILCQQSKQLYKAVEALKDAHTYHVATGHCGEIKRLEMEADGIYIQSISLLFEGRDAVEILRQKEILESLESATDRAEKASQIISDIIMKHA